MSNAQLLDALLGLLVILLGATLFIHPRHLVRAEQRASFQGEGHPPALAWLIIAAGCISLLDVAFELWFPVAMADYVLLAAYLALLGAGIALFVRVRRRGTAHV
jgi:hypothetical protein